MLDDSCPNCRRFRERAEEAEETLRQLIAETSPPDDDDPLPDQLSMTTTERTIYKMLRSRDGIFPAQIRAALYDDRPGDPPGAHIECVWICKMRRRLEPLGLSISHRTRNRHLGWRIVRLDEVPPRGEATWTNDLDLFVKRAFASGKSTREIAAAANAKFNVRLTRHAVGGRLARADIARWKGLGR